jgi:uracil-DNA glycosylase
MFFSNKKIIFLGYTAANWGIPNEDIVMGQAYGNKLPLYHPSYLLRNRILIANWMEQLERFVND